MTYNHSSYIRVSDERIITINFPIEKQESGWYSFGQRSSDGRLSVQHPWMDDPDQ